MLLELLLKFIYSGKATKFCEIFTLLLTVCTVVKSKVEISLNFVAFSEYMNFTLNQFLNPSSFPTGIPMQKSACKIPIEEDEKRQ